MDTRTGKNIARLFVAVKHALPEHAAGVMRDVILDIIDDNETTFEDKEFWRIVLGIETCEGRREALTLVTNGDPGDDNVRLAAPGEYDNH
jgi:hypothetical protein